MPSRIEKLSRFDEVVHGMVDYDNNGEPAVVYPSLKMFTISVAIASSL